MKEGSASHDKGFESFMNHARREADVSQEETPEERFERILSEIPEDLDAGLSPEEVRAHLAKLDVILESATNPATIQRAQELRSDITERYPDTFS